MAVLVAEGEVGVAGDVERLDVAVDGADAFCQDLSLALGWAVGAGWPAVLGDDEGHLGQAAGGHQASVMDEELLDRGLDDGDGPEDVGEEVESQVVEVVDEPLTAGIDELGEVAGCGAEQRRGVASHLDVGVAEPPGVSLGDGDAGDDRVGDAGVVAVEDWVVGDVRLFTDLQARNVWPVAVDQLSQEPAVALQVAGGEWYTATRSSMRPWTRRRSNLGGVSLSECRSVWPGSVKAR